MHSENDICNYIARDSERYAAIFAQRVFASIELLTDFPEMGRIVPEYDNPSLREKIFGNYRIVCRLIPHVVEIVAISRGSRLMNL
ncbi:MAG: type II toxin-antitoxin system RelE/ParE family toxin [Chitinivibrionales bacterium]|nr:type II toxin-antitoxin system RelE/ParE family toxin [Chitinivibrionales bacterium]